MIVTRVPLPTRLSAPDDHLRTGEVWRLRALVRFLRPHKFVVLAAMTAVVFAAAAQLAIAHAIRLVVDHGFSPGNESLLDRYFLALLGIVAALAAARFGQLYLINLLGERLTADIRKEVYGHVIGLSPALFDRIHTAEVLSRLTTDTTTLRMLVGLSVSVALRSVLVLVGGVALLVVTSPRLSAAVLLLMPVLLLPIGHLARGLRRLSRSSQDRLADLSARAGESLGAVEAVQAFTQEESEREAFGQTAEAACAVGIRRGAAWAGINALVSLLIFGLVTAVLWIGARDVRGGTMTGGELTSFVIYSLLVAGAVGGLGEVWGQLQEAAGATERLLELLEVKPDISSPAAPVALPEPPRGAVRFEHVGFRYPTRPEALALDDFSLDVAPGETVALVGPSGAGKTTVFKLLLRFYDPQSGRVAFDGVDLRQADPAAVRRRISLVSQDPIVFSGSVSENIRYGDPAASQRQVHDAAVAAGAIQFIEALPQGFETHLGQRGARLSAGERQRLAIARALLHASAVLLFDEATSSLDSESEQLVHQALDRLAGDCTTIIIAHRLATALKADRIVLMDEGRVIAGGTHEDLMQRGGMYARLVQLQFEIR